MAWPAALGAVAAAALPFAQSGIEYASAKAADDRAKHVANRQMKAAQFLAENQPSWAVEGLKKAGLNPILAATRGFPGAEFAPRQQGTATKSGDLVSGARQAARMAPELRVVNALADKSEAEATSARWQAMASRYLPEYEYHRAGAEAERWGQLQESMKLLREQQESVAASSEQTRVQTRLLATQLPSARAIEDLYERYPLLRQVGAAIKDLRR